MTAGSLKAECTGCLTVTLPPAPPTVSPALVFRGTTTTVIVTGANFAKEPAVTVSGTGVTAVVSPDKGTSSRLEVKVPVTGSAATNRRDVTVDNGDGGKSTCSACLGVRAPVG